MIEGDGVVRGLDVFAGFIDDGRLYLMGEIGAPTSAATWVYPLGTVHPRGPSFPAPAVPERWLEATYGPSWAVPDPAFKFTTSERTVTPAAPAGSAGTSTNRAAWERAYSGNRGRLPTAKPSPWPARRRRTSRPGEP